MSGLVLRVVVVLWLGENTDFGCFSCCVVFGRSCTKESVLHAGLLDLALNGTPSNYPDKDNIAIADFNNNFMIPKMVQKVIVDKKSIEDAIKETQTACQQIYDKYK